MPMTEQRPELAGGGFEQELQRASQLLSAEQLGEAQLSAAEALAQRPANVLAQNLLGLVLHRQGRFERALEIFDSLVRRNPDVVTLRLNAGHAALGAGNLDRALDHFQRSVELDPGHGRAFGYLALVHLRRREQHLARAALEEAGLQELADALGGPELDDGRQEELARELALRAPSLLPAREAGPAPHEGFAEVQPRVPVTQAPAPEIEEERPALEAEPEAEPEAPGPEDLEAAIDAAVRAASRDSAAPVRGKAAESATVELDAELPEEEEVPVAQRDAVARLEASWEAEPEGSWEDAVPEAVEVAAKPTPPAAGAEAPVARVEPEAQELASPEDARVEPEAQELASPEDARVEPDAEELTALEEEPAPPLSEAPKPALWGELQTVQVMVDAAAAATRTRRAGLSDSRPQGRATERLAGLALPGLYEGPAAALRAGLLVLRLGASVAGGSSSVPGERSHRAEGALVRSDRVLVCRGRLAMRPARRVRKGAERDPFVCEGFPLLLAEGEGALVLHPGPGLEVELLQLDDEALFLRESALCACSASLRWENGRIPGAGPDGPGIVQVRGTGFVALRRPGGRLHTVAVFEGEALSVQLDRLLGWTGKAVPQQIQRSGEIHTVSFTGEGMLLVSLLS
jgi:uncharacterized protein (AIM24 family)/tetratricopeptide (TPR) repeat protein